MHTTLHICRSYAGSNRFVSVPAAITHRCILMDCETNDLSQKLTKIKEVWSALTSPTTASTTSTTTSTEDSSDGSSGSHRGILFVPSSSDVKQTVGMLNFFGVKECKDLQALLGLTSVKPTAGAAHNEKDGNNARKSVRIDDDEDDSDSVNSGSKSGSSKVVTTRPDMITLAQQNRLGSTSLITPINNPDANPTSEGHNSDLPLITNELFVAPVSGTRGLHLQDIEYVFITHAPKTMDEYLHMAGECIIYLRTCSIRHLHVS